MTTFADHTVTLRPIATHDRDRIAEYLNDPAMFGLRQIETDGLTPLGDTAITSLVDDWAGVKTGLALAIAPTGVDELVGHALCDWGWDAMNPWLGVAVSPEHRRRGYGLAAANLVLGWVFDHTVAHTVQAWTPAWNDPGIAFLAALGFSSAGAVRRAWLRQGAWRDDLAFDLLESEWEAS